MKKNYVLDTNILLTSPDAIFGFEDNDVYITATTLQELDKKKTMAGEVGYNARRINHLLNDLCMTHKSDVNSARGLSLGNGGYLHFLRDVNGEVLPAGYSLDHPDNRIICQTKLLQENDSRPTILVTNDVSMRTNALVCHVDVEEYENDHIIDRNTKYRGVKEVRLSRDAFDLITPTLRSGQTYNITGHAEFDEEFTENEFVTIKTMIDDIDLSMLTIYRDGSLDRIPEGDTRAFGVTPRNDYQAYAMYALNAPVDEIPLVIINGPAGSAKTFLSLACGLEKTYGGKYQREYNKILITRNNITADADFGYLPGNINEKMEPLLAPFYDNLETLFSINNGFAKENLHGDIYQASWMQEEIRQYIEDLFLDHVIEPCPLAYMRGRSITNSFLIVDEAQNATVSQIRDIITRAGAGTKVILLGDPTQIDNHLLDYANNGLTYASEKMKGSPLCAQIRFSECNSVRSPLVTEALERLTLRR